jgi:hypothetical protein
VPKITQTKNLKNLEMASGEKPKRKYQAATFERVAEFLTSKKQKIITTKEEFEKEQKDANGERITNSWKKIKYMNADSTPAESTYYGIMNETSQNKTKAEMKLVNAAKGEKQKERQPKGTPTNNLIEENVINFALRDMALAGIIKDERQSIHLMEFRKYDYAIPIVGQDQIYNPLQEKGRITGDPDERWTINITVAEILDIIKEDALRVFMIELVRPKPVRTPSPIVTIAKMTSVCV